MYIRHNNVYAYQTYLGIIADTAQKKSCCTDVQQPKWDKVSSSVVTVIPVSYVMSDSLLKRNVGTNRLSVGKEA